MDKKKRRIRIHNFFLRLKPILRKDSYLPADAAELFKRAVTLKNESRLHGAIIFFIFMQVADVIIYAFNVDNSSYGKYFLNLSVMFIGLGILYSVYYHLCISKTTVSLSTKKTVNYCMWVALTVLSILDSYGEITENGTMTRTTIILVGLSMVPIMRLFEVLPLIIAVLGFSSWFGIASDAPFYIIKYLIVIAALAVVNSAARYLSFLDVFTESNSMRMMNKELSMLAIKDPLTQVLNRRGLINMVERYHIADASCAVYMLDIDYFKKYNDKYFHAAGDRCLRMIADALTRCVFRKNDLVARYGGEEFLICIFGIECRDVLSVARRIQTEISKLDIDFSSDGQDDRVTLSIGIAFSPEKSEFDFDRLVEAADVELYHAKTNGRNCISFDGAIYRNGENTLPVKQNEEIEKTAQPGILHDRRIVIVVDDHPVNCDILTHILEPEYAVMTAEDGAQAMRLLESNANDVTGMILDLFMHVMDGFSVLRALHSDERYKNIPVIVATGSDDKENEKKALRLGAWDFVSKPYDANIILFRLKNAIARSQLTAFNQLKRLAEYDALTEIYNKNRFCETVGQLIKTSENEKYVLICFDIDRFQLINSFFGIEEGDRLLRHIASVIKNFCCGNRPSVYGRMVNDSFALCIVYSNEQEVYDIAHSIRHRIKSFNIDFDIVPTFGAYIIEDTELSVELMIDCARLAAKQIKGGNYTNACIIYNEDMKRAIELQQEITSEMQSALEGGQFTVYLQPEYNLSTEEICGAEALVRWKHPQKGMIMPNLFIPVFERNGFITRLDRFVREQVCIMLRKLIDSGFEPLPISVNISRVNLYNAEFVEELCELTAKYNIPNSLLNLELTESAYTENPEVIYEKVAQLRERGFRVMMDDFGSGYSSLNVLKEINVDALKIDMRFLSGNCEDERGNSIIAAVVNMAKQLEISTVAEGVERHVQSEFLRSVGCDFAQGYLFSKPIPMKEFEALVKER